MLLILLANLAGIKIITTTTIMMTIITMVAFYRKITFLNRVMRLICTSLPLMMQTNTAKFISFFDDNQISTSISSNINCYILKAEVSKFYIDLCKLVEIKQLG